MTVTAAQADTLQAETRSAAVGPAAVGSSVSGAAASVGEFRARVREVFAPFVPQADDWERDGHLPRELFGALGAAGLLRERWAAGAARGLPLARALCEEIAPINGGAMLALSIHSEVFAHALHAHGGATHRETLSAALDGRVIGCVALTEPGGGSDLLSMSTRAVRDSGGGWRLTGVKRFTTNVGRASHVLTLARTGTADHAFSLFLIPLDAPGVTITRFLDTLGMRSADTGGVEFDAHLADEHLVGRADAGLVYTLKLLDYERIAAAFGLVATARAAIALAAAHLRERVQFGKRLFDHQALAHRLANRWADTEAAAALVDTACAQARGDQLPHHLVAAAKLLAARAATEAADEGIQLFGGRGYTMDYPLERMYRDSRLARIGGGTDEMLRQIICTHLDVLDAAAAESAAHFADRFAETRPAQPPYPAGPTRPGATGTDREDPDG